MHLFEYLETSERNLVIEKHFFKDEIIFQEEEKCEYLSLIKEGFIKISTYLKTGNEVIYKEVKTGDFFGNNLLFSSSPFYKGNVICLEDTTLLLIKKNDLLKVLQENRNFLLHYLLLGSDQSKKQNEMIKILSIESLEERFITYLEISSGEITLDSIANLSSKLRVRRETLSRLISKLVKEKIIEKKKNKIVLL